MAPCEANWASPCLSLVSWTWFLYQGLLQVLLQPSVGTKQKSLSLQNVDSPYSGSWAIGGCLTIHYLSPLSSGATRHQGWDLEILAQTSIIFRNAQNLLSGKKMEWRVQVLKKVGPVCEHNRLPKSYQRWKYTFNPSKTDKLHQCLSFIILGQESHLCSTPLLAMKSMAKVPLPLMIYFTLYIFFKWKCSAFYFSHWSYVDFLLFFFFKKSLFICKRKCLEYLSFGY